MWGNIIIPIFAFQKKGILKDSYIDLIKLLLPEILVDYFELISIKKEAEILHLNLKEINSIPKEYREFKLSSKGFFPEITVQDFGSSLKLVGNIIIPIFANQKTIKNCKIPI